MAVYSLSQDDLGSRQDLNINISAYRVLYILLLLIQYRSLGSVELNGFLFDNPLIRRAYNAETLTKYINTLREVGCRIPRSSSRNDYCYELLENPFPIQLDESERRVALKMLDLLSSQADESLSEGFESLLQKLAWSVEPPLVWPGRRGNRKDDQGIMPDERALVRRYRKYCRDMFLLALTVQADGQEPRELTMEPYEVVIEQGNPMLLGVDARTREQHMVALEDIASVRQLPSKNRHQACQIHVVFALYGRLASSYRLYPGEKIIFRGPDRMHVKARVLETTGLVNRLMKYGPSCQVLSPVSVRETMRDRLSRLLDVLLSTE